jgi:hypothetical protein
MDRPTKMRAGSCIFIFALLCAAGQLPSARAGTASSNQTAKEIEDLGVIEAAGPDEVGAPKFRASVQVRGEFTTNAKLSGNHSSGDLITFPQVEVGFNLPMRHNFSFDIAAKIESGIYADHQDRGFIGYSIISTLDWRPKINWPRIYVGAEPYRYDSFDTGDRITQAIGLTAGTDWGYAFNKGYSMAFVGYSFSDYYADPSIDDRGQHRAIIGVSHQFNQRIVGTLFYQFSYSDYHNVDRSDYRNLLGATLTYQFTRGIFGSLTTSFADNDSSQDFASYQAFNIGLGVNVQF